jgi:hypothetical protein
MGRTAAAGGILGRQRPVGAEIARRRGLAHRLWGEPAPRALIAELEARTAAVLDTARAAGAVHESVTVAEMPPWPTSPVTYGPVVLRRFSASDVPMVRELSTDPYVPLIGTLPPNASEREARAYIDRQLGRLAEGRGLSFAIARPRGQGLDPARRRSDLAQRRGILGSQQPQAEPLRGGHPIRVNLAHLGTGHNAIEPNGAGPVRGRKASAPWGIGRAAAGS